MQANSGQFPAQLSLARIVLVANVLGTCQFSRPNLVLADCLPVTLPSQMMDITAPDPHCSVSRFDDSFAEFSFVCVIWQISIKPTQFLPQTTAYEEGEP